MEFLALIFKSVFIIAFLLLGTTAIVFAIPGMGGPIGALYPVLLIAFLLLCGLLLYSLGIWAFLIAAGIVGFIFILS